jgi:hypothetical protein
MALALRAAISASGDCRAQRLAGLLRQELAIADALLVTRGDGVADARRSLPGIAANAFAARAHPRFHLRFLRLDGGAAMTVLGQPLDGKLLQRERSLRPRRGR